MVKQQMGKKTTLKFLVDSSQGSSTPWQSLSSFIRRERLRGVEVRSISWPQQQTLLRLVNPLTQQQKLKYKVKKGRSKLNGKSMHADHKTIKIRLAAKTGAALKRELLSRNMSQNGTKADLIARLYGVFVAENNRSQGYRWWSDLETELNDFYQRVEPVQIPNVSPCFDGTCSITADSFNANLYLWCSKFLCIGAQYCFSTAR